MHFWKQNYKSASPVFGENKKNINDVKTETKIAKPPSMINAAGNVLKKDAVNEKGEFNKEQNIDDLKPSTLKIPKMPNMLEIQKKI